MENGVASYFLYLGSGDVGVVALDFCLGQLHEVALALVVLGQPVAVAVGALAALAAVAQQAHLLPAHEAARGVRLPHLRRLGLTDAAGLVGQ